MVSGWKINGSQNKDDQGKELFQKEGKWCAEGERMVSKRRLAAVQHIRYEVP